jgi:type I restriction enzyme S subunit
MSESTLSDLCLKVTDGTHDSPKLLPDGIPFIKGKHINKGYVDFDTCDYISHADHLKVISRSKPEQGDILFANIGNSIGDTAFVATTKPFSIKNVALFKPNPAKINCRYLYYHVISRSFQDALLAKKQGSAQPFLALDTLRNHRVLHHRNLHEQDRIAAILSPYDDLIENNTRRIKILEQVAQLLYREWFVTFRFPGYEKVRMVDSELGPIPEDWRVGRLEEAVVMQRGFDLPIAQRVPGEVPIIAATGLNGTHNEAKVKGPGVVTGRSGSLGTVMFVWEDFWPLNTALWAKEFRQSNPVHAYFTLQAVDLKGFNSGAAVPTLNRNDIHGLPTVLPDRGTLNIFNECVLPLFRLKRTLESKNSNLRTTRDLLLPKLISGEISVEATNEASAELVAEPA